MYQKHKTRKLPVQVSSFLPTNVFLTKIGIKEDQNCSFCSGSSENLAHLFWLCPKVSLFWDNLVERLEQFKLIPRNYSKDVAIFLGLRSDNSVSAVQLNLCFLLARYFIWCCRVNKKIPLLKSFLLVLKSQFHIESYKSRANQKKWEPLFPFLNIN